MYVCDCCCTDQLPVQSKQSPVKQAPVKQGTKQHTHKNYTILIICIYDDKPMKLNLNS